MRERERENNGIIIHFGGMVWRRRSDHPYSWRCWGGVVEITVGRERSEERRKKRKNYGEKGWFLANFGSDFHHPQAMKSTWCGLAQKHQQGPITCSKCSNDSVQDKGIKRGTECIGFECFNQVRIERSIRVSRGDPSTSYPYARGVQYNLIWAMRWRQQRKQKNPTITLKQHGWLPFHFVSRVKGLHGRL